MCLDPSFMILTQILANLCHISVFAFPATAAILKWEDFKAMKVL